MRHFPISIDLRGQTIVVSGAGPLAVAEIERLMVSEAHITVFGTEAHDDVRGWAEAGRLTLIERPLADGDADGARLVFAANQNGALDAEAVRIGEAAGSLTTVITDQTVARFDFAAGTKPNSAATNTTSPLQSEKSGHVWLVGAGPGDPEMLTVKAVNRLQGADVVLYDRLIDPRILELVRREAILIETGKSAGKPGWSQDAINAAMIEHARDGHQVVRLKSGDPLIFGRADEEMDALEAANVSFDIVPGITSAIAAAAQAKISLTRRGRNSDIRLMTAHDTDGYAEQDWKALASGKTAAAVYMGVKAARFLQGRLMLNGADPSMPVTAIEKISRPDEKRVDGTLSDFVAAMADAGIEGPAILLVGLAARDAAIVDLHPDTAAAVWAF